MEKLPIFDKAVKTKNGGHRDKEMSDFKFIMGPGFIKNGVQSLKKWAIPFQIAVSIDALISKTGRKIINRQLSISGLQGFIPRDAVILVSEYGGNKKNREDGLSSPVQAPIKIKAQGLVKRNGSQRCGLFRDAWLNDAQAFCGGSRHVCQPPDCKPDQIGSIEPKEW